MLRLEMRVIAFSIGGESSIHAPIDITCEAPDSELALTEALLGELHLNSFFTLFEFSLLNRKELITFSLL